MLTPESTMKNLVIYRILAYLLLFVAAFLSAGIFLSIPAALMAPATLLPLFLMSCIVIYTYCSWRFLVRGIDKNMVLKPSLRDLIRINGYITLVLAGLMLFQMIVMLTQPGLINEILDQLRAAQPEGAEITDEMLIKWTHFILRFLTAYSALLVVHTLLTLRMIKQYAYVFDEPADMSE
ncbi:MAG: hypothetical protein ABW036_03080 [Flavitalea sp.]